MDPVILERVCVFADDSASADGPLLHAKDWASCLGLPLEILNQAGSDIKANDLFRPRCLSVFSNTLPHVIKGHILQGSVDAHESATLVCPPSHGPVSRALILHDAHADSVRMLSSALALCGLLQAVPVILTTADSEAAARHGRRIAEAACFRHRISAYLDYVAGMDLRSAVGSIARWRRCSHVIMAPRRVTSWWNRAGADTLEILLKSADSLNFLVLPERGILLPTGAGSAAGARSFSARLDYSAELKPRTIASVETNSSVT
jgi:hypothetical protein